MLLMPRLQLLDGRLDELHASLLAHLGRREVAVQARAVPVAGDRLGIDRHLGRELLGYAVQKEARQPQLVAHLDAHAGPDLELPLRRHHFGVGAGNLDARVEARAVVRFDDVALHDLAGADAAVVRALGGGVAWGFVSDDTRGEE